MALIEFVKLAFKRKESETDIQIKPSSSTYPFNSGIDRYIDLSEILGAGVMHLDTSRQRGLSIIASNQAIISNFVDFRFPARKAMQRRCWWLWWFEYTLTAIVSGTFQNPIIIVLATGSVNFRIVMGVCVRIR